MAILVFPDNPSIVAAADAKVRRCAGARKGLVRFQFQKVSSYICILSKQFCAFFLPIKRRNRRGDNYATLQDGEPICTIETASITASPFCVEKVLFLGSLFFTAHLKMVLKWYYF